jgi:thioredoxin reductase (NADPH)
VGLDCSSKPYGLRLATGEAVRTRTVVIASGARYRKPALPEETSRPGVFAVGDVRSGSVKRVASAVGEGSVCVQLIHRALREV